MARAQKSATRAKRREPLSRERVLDAALALVDEAGIEALTMRRLGQALGVEAMSLYGHVENKEALLDGLVERVMAEITLAPRGCDFRAALRVRALSTYEVLMRHPWAASLMESNAYMGPTKLRHAEALLGCLRDAGFAIELAQKAGITIDSYVYGFVIQVQNWTATPSELAAVVGGIRPSVPIETYPHLHEMMDHLVRKRGVASCGQSEVTSYEEELRFGLELILEGLERARVAR